MKADAEIDALSTALESERSAHARARAALAAANARADAAEAREADMRGERWGDRSTPEDEAIAAVHPTRTGRHDLYAEAMRLVGARKSKGALVELVNWLLVRADKSLFSEAYAKRGTK